MREPDGEIAVRRVWTVNVLLVDDDPGDTALIMDVLRRDPQVSSAKATDAPEFALRQIKFGRLKPDLILLDIRMPRLDGFTFLERLREIPAMARTPVVFLTTSRLQSDVLRTKGSTASLYVVKPDSYTDLQTRLCGVLRRAVSGRWGH
ncbi:MAG TPA: response regulator [Caulobacteraceae bacterium]|nr:response regulator [Caulobacteraceae bacterium]